MGSDLHMNPPPPPPLWEQVKALQESYMEARATIGKQQAEILELETKLESNDRLIAKLLRDTQEMETTNA